MKTIYMISAAVVLLFSLQSCNNSKNQNGTPTAGEGESEPKRFISLNGTITEILSELGYEEQIVAVDVTSVYPESVKENASDLGHVMNLSIESLLQQQPTEIFAIREELSEEVIDRLNNLEIPVHYYSLDYSLNGAKDLIKEIAGEVGAEPDSLLQQIDGQVTELHQFDNQPRVMFIYARGAGTLLVAGQDTPAAAMIEIAGGENAVNEYKDYRPLTTEAVAQANPDVLLLFTNGLQSINGIEGLREIPGLANTTAVKEGNIIGMDGLFLTGFGPRTGDAVKDLNSKLRNHAE